jgi:hypothetical protein
MAHAQDTNPTPPASAADANTQAWQQQKSAPPPAFQTLRSALNEVLAGPNLDPQRHAYHFVVLMNTAKTEGAGPQMMRDICYGLLRYELAAGPGSGDEFTLVPFQLHVREADSRWNETFSPQRAPELYSSIPLSPAIEAGTKGGNDIEGALLQAASQVKDPQSALYITLSDNEVSQPPVQPATYSLTDADPQSLAARLKAAHLVEAKSGRVEFSQQEATPGAGAVYIYYRIYTPDNLRPLGEWTTTTRDQLLAGTPPPAPAPHSTAPQHPVAPVHSEADQRPAPKVPVANPEPAPDYTWLIVGLVVVALLGAGIGYSVLAKRPHSISVGVNSMRTAQIVPGRPLFLGAGEGNGMIPIDGLPDDVAPGEKVAQVDVSPFGAVTVRSAAWKVENSPVTVTDTRRVRVSRNNSGGLLGGDSITLTVKKDA